MRNYIVLLLIVFCSFNLYAQSERLQSSEAEIFKKDFLDIPSELKNRISDFFVQLSLERIESAFSKLLLDSPMMGNKEQMRTLLSETYRAVEYYGKISGYESVDYQQPASSIIRARYIGLHENLPVRWVFSFYNSPKLGWIVTNIKFDDLSQYYFDEFIK